MNQPPPIDHIEDCHSVERANELLKDGGWVYLGMYTETEILNEVERRTYQRVHIVLGRIPEWALRDERITFGEWK